MDSSGNSYVTGNFVGPATFGAGETNQTTLLGTGSLDIFVAKYDGNGMLEWAKEASGLSNSLGSGIAVDDSGNGYVTGSFVGPTTFGAEETNQTTLLGTGSFDIFVAKYILELEARIEALIDDAEELLTGGILSNGQANSLVSKLENILRKLEQGQTGPAINQLDAFISQVLSLVDEGVLTPEEGQDLADAAQAVIDELTE